MGELLNKPYEISVWEDKLTQDGSGFEEQKIAIIGSNTMSGPNKVYDPIFNKKANGEKTLTFSLKYKYFDPYSGNEEVINPFAALLVNERKVKLHYDNKWYEFVVKDHTEANSEYTWTYTCTDAFVLELSKIGYNLEFSADLNNNQGTAKELAQKTIEDTDWRLGGARVGKQLIEEPIYKATLLNADKVHIVNASGTTMDVPGTGAQVYVFYNYVKNQNGKFVQFISQEQGSYEIDDRNVITATNFRIQEDLTFKEYLAISEPEGNPEEQKWYELIDNQYVLSTDTEVDNTKTYYHFHPSFWLNTAEIISIEEAETHYKANRLAYNQLTTYDPVLQRTVDRFKIGDREVYRYTDYTYTTSNVVMNYLSNGDNFNALEDGTLQGWNPYVGKADGTAPSHEITKLKLVTRPELASGVRLADINLLSQIEGFLVAHFDDAFNSDYENAIYNEGFKYNTSFINAITQGERFLFRWRAGKGTLDNMQPVQNLGLIVAKYTQDEPTWGYYYKHIDPENIFLRIEGPAIELNNIIEGGTIQETGEYVIDGVVQTPSTKYIYISNGEEYVWDGENSEFIPRDNSNYLPYYYIVGEAKRAITNAVLTDPAEKIGVFIYPTGNSAAGDYFIQDIQFTRYISDANEQPILIGNVPTATSKPTEYYYLKPSIGSDADDVETFTSPSELLKDIGAEGELEPLYNDESEKVLSISVSQSNCFNVLQTIAETFECWIDLVVDHDTRGYINRDKDGRPRKYVYLNEYAGKDNWAGFKYGINLDTIERNVNSDEIVTKLIVDQSQSDYVPEGYVSIANAKSNSSGESYILNFDYYYSQGLLDRDSVEADKAEFIAAVKDINLEYQKKEAQRRDLEASFTNLASKRNVYTELIETAKDTKNKAREEFKQLTGQTYDEYRQDQLVAIKYNDNFYILTRDTEIILDKTYYTTNSDKTVMTAVESPVIDDINTYYELLADLTKEDTIYDVLGDLYVSSATINNYGGLLSNIETEYWDVRTKLRGSENYKVSVWVTRDELNERHVMIELSDFLPGFTFEIGGQSRTSSVSTSFFDIQTDATEITFTAPEGYTIDTTTYEINDNKVEKFKITNDATVAGVEDEIEDLLDEKKELTKDFNNRYSRFIQEGTWNSTDYIDSELYYLDALQVSGTSAFPAISYTINVVEISQLEGYEGYQFDAGDKSYIEDTEFFGWANKNGVLTPAREEVIVSEVEWHLDDPSQNVITVQNYKTRFEDFFQRVNAAVQTVQYNEATYAKISSLMDANGTINQDVLVQSLNQIAGQNYNLTSDGSVLIDGDHILVRNLNNSANRVIINSEGIRISSDGGVNWATAIDGRGINIGTVRAGMLNTDQVVIGGADSPSFRWDKSGISAYKSKRNEQGELDGAYDLQTYVRYDEYGLYGIKNDENFKATSLNDIKNKAHFAVTWDGFFIRNNYTGGGRVEITSDNDFRVLNTVDNKENEKIKIGALEWIVPADATFSSEKTYYVKTENGYVVVEEPKASEINTYYEKKYEPQPGVEPSLYGIRIKNNAGKDVMTTDDDGNLVLTGAIEALEGNFGKLITVGKNDNDTPNWIEIDGTSSTIRTSDFNEGAGTGWMINALGDAVFTNITARGAIKTAVFEYAEIQAVGGVFLFRPSSTIKRARIAPNNTDLILEVEKPQLFVKITYNKIDNPDSKVNPQDAGWYEHNNYGYKLSQDVSIVSDKEYFNRVDTSGSWCKVSNYISTGNEPDIAQSILVNNGLTHVYQVIDVNLESKEITLSGAAVMVNGESPIVTLDDLKGGALVDMGREDGSTNYGIGVNSSDNTVNLPARAISLFETNINKSAGAQLKVTYDYRGILGTLPVLAYEDNNALVNSLYHDYMEGTQGIYTDNMYLGNRDQYIAFYTAVDESGVKTKHLKINAKEFTLKAGALRNNTVDATEGFLYLSNEDYITKDGNGISINNSGAKTDWRLIIGNKFGVDKAGNLYATNANISGHIQATSGTFGNQATINDSGDLIIEQGAINGLQSALDKATGYVLTVETDYSSQQNVHLTARLYYGNTEVTDTKPSSMFRWYRKSETLDYFIVENPAGNPQEKGWYEKQEVEEDGEVKIKDILTTDTEVVDGKDYYEYTNIEPLGGAYSIRFDRNTAGYGTTIICRFNDEALLTTPDNYAVETPDNYLLTARV